MGLSLAFGIIALLAMITFVRLAPVNVLDWNVSPGKVIAAGTGQPDSMLYPPEVTNGVVEMHGGAYAVLLLPATSPEAVLHRLRAIAPATPSTRLLDDPDPANARRLTFETRSRVFSFPDYTTVQALAEGTGVRLELVARLRFGRNDLGVNAARLQDWLSRL